jgi:FkbM family methyltransferase
MKFFPTNLSTATWTNPDYRIEDLEILRSILKPGDTFVDIGANIGTISLEASYLVGNEGRVIAFEPTKLIYECFVQNIALNDMQNITSYNLALGDKKKIVSFSSSHADTMNKIGSGEEKVQMDTLDEILLDISIDFMKVDVE